MRIVKLEGFGLFVDNLDDMVCFYKHTLGFEIDYEPDAGHVYLKKDGVLFLMYPRSAISEMLLQSFRYPKGLNGTFEIALAVDNFQAVDDTFAELIAKGATPIMAPKTMPWGQRTCFIADPEGNLIEIGSFVQEDFIEREE